MIASATAAAPRTFWASEKTGDVQSSSSTASVGASTALIAPSHARWHLGLHQPDSKELQPATTYMHIYTRM